MYLIYVLCVHVNEKARKNYEFFNLLFYIVKLIVHSYTLNDVAWRNKKIKLKILMFLHKLQYCF